MMFLHKSFESRADLGFLFVGGMHQALHLAPVALALAARGVAVTAYVPPDDVDELTALLAALDPTAADGVRVVSMARPAWVRVAGTMLRGLARKPMLLAAWRNRLLRHDALVAAERTSTILKRWPGRKPVMLHIPHGAGDRAGGFDPRIGLFDHVLVNGTFVRDRTIADGIAPADRLTIIGSVKLAVLTRPTAPPPPALFADDRPVVLYNPHFDTALSSWRLARALADAIAASGRYNLIVAPHVRLIERIGADELAEWTRFGRRPGVHFDLTSPALRDMSYTRAADIYLGDVSSQVYEFLAQPRPAVFVNAHGTAWMGDPNYRMWTLGEVAQDAPTALAALDRAAGRHRDFVTAQAAAVEAVLGPTDPDVPERAAEALLAALARVQTHCR